MKSMITDILRGLGASVALATVTIAGAVWVSTAQPAAAAAKATTSEDTLVFRDGRVLKGTILSETATTVRFKGSVGGIAFDTEYNRADILTLTKGVAAKPAPSADVKAPDVPANTTASADPGDNTSKRVYVIPLRGEFGEDISQKPILRCLKDARDNKADIVIFEIENKWSYNSLTDRKAEDGEFDSLGRAEEMESAFTKGPVDGWATPPRTICWVRQAMGGASFVPLVFKEIYFSPNARMGGIGDLSQYFQGSDENARQKQISLRMGRARGMAITGGHAPELVDAMAIREYVLSYTFKNGKVELLPNQMPSGPNEILLTDDGKEERADDLKQLVRGEGNDTLTFHAKQAQDVGLSKGTVEEIDELFFQIGAGKNPIRVDAKAAQIMKQWSDDIVRSKKRLKEILEEYVRAQGTAGGTYEERTKQRGVRRRCLNEIKSIYSNFGEGIGGRWRGENGMPPESQIETLLKQIELEQAADKKR
jgi:hypothetical protein